MARNSKRKTRTQRSLAKRPKRKRVQLKASRGVSPSSRRSAGRTIKASTRPKKARASKRAAKVKRGPAPKRTRGSGAVGKTREAISSVHSEVDLQSRIRELIKLAKEQGYLTFDDLNEALPEGLTDADDLDAILIRLRKMEIDIIEASEVDRFKDGKKDAEEEEEEKPETKLDILDDPVRMYLKQMGQVPLLTREQEVEISKRIEEAENMVQKLINRFGFIARAHLDLAAKLTEGRERFDRVILDKKIESRERYMKMLPRLCKQVDKLSGSISQQYGKLMRNSSKRDTKKSKIFQRSVASLQRLYPKFYFKQKVTEEFVHLADEQYGILLRLKSEAAKRPRTRSAKSSLSVKVGELEKALWLSLDQYGEQYQDLKNWLL